MFEFIFAWLGRFLAGIALEKVFEKSVEKVWKLIREVFGKRYGETSGANDETRLASAEEQTNEALSYWNKSEDKGKNRKKAIELWHEAEKRGNPEAQYMLGCLYSTGKLPAGLDEKRGFRL